MDIKADDPTVAVDREKVIEAARNIRSSGIALAEAIGEDDEIMVSMTLSFLVNQAFRDVLALAGLEPGDVCPCPNCSARRSATTVN
jgi:hypothetical protein